MCVYLLLLGNYASMHVTYLIHSNQNDGYIKLFNLVLNINTLRDSNDITGQLLMTLCEKLVLLIVVYYINMCIDLKCPACMGCI